MLKTGGQRLEEGTQTLSGGLYSFGRHATPTRSAVFDLAQCATIQTPMRDVVRWRWGLRHLVLRAPTPTAAVSNPPRVWTARFAGLHHPPTPTCTCHQPRIVDVELVDADENPSPEASYCRAREASASRSSPLCRPLLILEKCVKPVPEVSDSQTWPNAAAPAPISPTPA